MAIYVYKMWQRPSFTCTFCYTWSDQHYTVPYPWTYIITAKGAWSYTSAWWLACGDFVLNTWDELSIMVGEKGSVCCCGRTYGFWWSSTTNCRNWGGLSWVFIGCNAITACDSDRALVIWGGAWWWYNATCYWWKWWWECWQNGSTCGYGTAWAWGTQTWHGSWGNVWANQFNGWNGSGCAWHGWWGGRWWGNGSKWDSSWICDDKGAWWWSGYVKSTATNPTLTQWWGATACSNWEVKITYRCWPLVSTAKVIWDIYLWCNS